MTRLDALEKLLALGDRWALQVRELCESGAIGALVRELAMQAQCLALDDAATPARITLRVERRAAHRSARGVIRMGTSCPRASACRR